MNIPSRQTHDFSQLNNQGLLLQGTIPRNAPPYPAAIDWISRANLRQTKKSPTFRYKTSSAELGTISVASSPWCTSWGSPSTLHWTKRRNCLLVSNASTYPRITNKTLTKESIISPLNATLLVGTGIRISVGHTRLTSEESVEVGPLLVSTALLDCVALRALRLEDLGSFLGVSVSHGYDWRVVVVLEKKMGGDAWYLLPSSTRWPTSSQPQTSSVGVDKKKLFFP